MPNPSDEIKSKLDIVELIREYIPLKAAGLNFRANCPFHREKTPSFMVSSEKQIWHCFGCGKGGDVFSFVMEMESLSFVEALRQLAKKAGVVLKRADPALSSKRNNLLDMVEAAAVYYHKVLVGSQAGQAARQYLTGRGLTGQTIEEWRLGYSPDGWENLVSFLKNKGFKEDDIFLAGLSVKRRDQPGFYDRFRGRIMFPLKDVNGNAVGFTARVMPSREAEEKMGKYINTPATLIYDKSKILFGLDKAKMTVKAEDAAVLTEGQMDAIMAHQHGFANVIASSGTALTAEQINLIKRFSNNLFLSFDADAAGELAAERGIAAAMAAEMNIKVIEIKNGKDPDECLRNNPGDWPLAVAAAKPVMQYYFDKVFARLSKNDYEGQSLAIKTLLPQIAKFGSRIEQDYWLKKLSQEVDANESSLREKLEEIKKRYKTPSAQSGPAAAAEPDALKQSREAKQSELLLALALKYPAQLEYVINHVAPDHLVGQSGKFLYKNLIIYYNKLIDLWTREGGNFDLIINYSDLRDWLSNPANLTQADQGEEDGKAGEYNCTSLLDRLALLADKDFYDFSEERVKAEIMVISANLRINYLNNRRHHISRLIAETEKGNLAAGEKDEKLKNLLQEFKNLTDEMGLMEIR